MMLVLPEGSGHAPGRLTLIDVTCRIRAIRFSLKWRFRLQVTKNKTLASSSSSAWSHSDIALFLIALTSTACSMARRSRPCSGLVIEDLIQNGIISSWMAAVA